MSLPPEVLALLGDDATPERAIASLTAHRDESHPCADMDADEALGMYQHALAAAAIRACEAGIAYHDAMTMSNVYNRRAHPGEWPEQKELTAASAAYEALRNWRKP